MEQKRKTVSYSTVDTTRGTYMTLGAAIQHLGGWQWGPAIVGAKRLAAQCARLRGKWHTKDEFTGLSKFLVLQEEYADTLTECWERLTTWRKEKEVISHPGGDGQPPSGTGSAEDAGGSGRKRKTPSGSETLVKAAAKGARARSSSTRR